MAMRVPQGLFPYPSAAVHPYAAHPAALAAHHAAAAAAWNNLKSGNPMAAFPRYWFPHPQHWPAASFDPVAMAASAAAASTAGSTSPSFILPNHQGDSSSRSPVSNSSGSPSPTPELIVEPSSGIKIHQSVDKAILDLRVKIAGPEETSL